MLRIHINQDDIDKGEPRKGCECALARALNRRFGADTAIVGCGSASILRKNIGTYRGFFLMRSAVDFVTQFDHNKSAAKPCVVCLGEEKP